MFRTLIYPSSGACDYSIELPHWLYCSWCDVCWSFCVVGLEWYPCCSCASACHTDTTPTQPHRNSNTHRTKNNTTNMLIQQNSRKPLMVAILMSETCWAHRKWNKIASDINLVFQSSTKTIPPFVYRLTSVACNGTVRSYPLQQIFNIRLLFLVSCSQLFTYIAQNILLKSTMMCLHLDQLPGSLNRLCCYNISPGEDDTFFKYIYWAIHELLMKWQASPSVH